mgnify:CR=1 FL=1
MKIGGSYHMANVQLRVSPDEMQRQAARIEEQIRQAKKSWNSLYEAAHASRRYWEGDAADYRHRLLEETRQEVLAVLGRLKEHPVRLLQMAGIYTEAETKATGLVQALPDDAIQ